MHAVVLLCADTRRVCVQIYARFKRERERRAVCAGIYMFIAQFLFRTRQTGGAAVAAAAAAATYATSLVFAEHKTTSQTISVI